MTDYFGRLLGVSTNGSVRPRLPGRYEPIAPEHRPAADLLSDTETGPSRASTEAATEPSHRDHAGELGQHTEAGRIQDTVDGRRPPSARRTVAETPEPAVLEPTADGPAAARRSHRVVVPLTARSESPTRQPAQPRIRLSSGTPTDRRIGDPTDPRPNPAAPAGRAGAVSVAGRMSNAAPQPPDAPAIGTVGQPVRPPTGLILDHPVGEAVNQSAADEAAADQPADAPMSGINRGRDQGRSAVGGGNRSGRGGRESAAAVTEPVINVSIGRIEVTATAPARTATRRSAKPAQTQSLAHYLAERDGGRR